MKRHGISLGLHRAGSHFFVVITAIGKLTHDDYSHITPFLESSLKQVSHPQIRMMVDLTEFEGWELRAAWDDLKLGLRHGSEFEKIALVGRSDWQKLMSSVAGWFTQGETQYFDNESDALAWLNAEG